ncbi:MAG TPA: exodeoxyribonuclease VII large subunit [Bacteroidales bacterium]|nr:exodeoxyribonuclease VII large subunit [Bacteroidales bacterium]
MTELKSISLYELNNSLKRGIKELFPDTFWVTGEICEMNINQSGHCYLELIEKASETEQITARAKANIWAFTFRMLKPYFESVTGQRFSIGLKVMLNVSIEFHEVYGYSLNVKDIEPNFTVGDITRKRQEIINRLQNEGVFDLNKELELPLVPQRIAVISSETAAGYGDFVDQLTDNDYGYKFRIKLFNAYMQGESAQQSIIDAMDKIFEEIHNFDVVVIIRGGGSQADLDCFNAYWLCYHITQFPIPILTGIGHDRDETIADLVAHSSLKTPTAVAQFIIAKTTDFESHLQEVTEEITDLVTGKLLDLKENLSDFSHRLLTISKLSVNSEKQRLTTIETYLKSEVRDSLKKNRQALQALSSDIQLKTSYLLTLQKKHLATSTGKLKMVLKSQLKNEHTRLEQDARKIDLLDPAHILKRGYSLTFCNGLLIKNAENLKPGDVIESKWHKNSALSKVLQVNPTTNQND